MESCARGDYARERNKTRDKDGGIFERREKTERWERGMRIIRGGGVAGEEGGRRMEKEIFCGARSGSP